MDIEARGDRARWRIDRAQTRSAELMMRLAELRDRGEGTGSTPTQVRRAARLAADSRRNAQVAAERAALIHSAAARMHFSAAHLHDELADSGVGDTAEHRWRAADHRALGAVQREHAIQCRRQQIRHIAADRAEQ